MRLETTLRVSAIDEMGGTLSLGKFSLSDLQRNPEEVLNQRIQQIWTWKKPFKAVRFAVTGLWETMDET